MLDAFSSRLAVQNIAFFLHLFFVAIYLFFPKFASSLFRLFLLQLHYVTK